MALPSASILVLLAFGALAVGVIWLVRRDAERRHHAEQARWFEARARGWQYQAPKSADGGFTLRGETHGVHWEFTHIAGDGSDTAARSRWSTTAVTAREPAFQLLGRKTYEILKGGVGRALAKLARWADRGEGGALALAELSFVAQGQDIPAGSATFRKTFALVGANPDFGRVIDAETESLLTSWPRSTGRHFRPELHLSAQLDGRGLLLALAVPITEIGAIEHAVRLGVAITQRVRQIKR
jgi:hypothetical protein